MTPQPPGLVQRLQALIWATSDLPAWKAAAVRTVRTILILGRDVAMGQLTLRAMGLVYTTLLSIVPLLALSSNGDMAGQLRAALGFAPAVTSLTG